MKCYDIREKFSDFHDNDPDVFDEVSLHLKTCPDCLAEYRKFEDLIKDISNLPALEPPLGLHKRLLTHVKKNSKFTRQRKSGYIHRFALVAAASLVFVVIWIFGFIEDTADYYIMPVAIHGDFAVNLEDMPVFIDPFAEFFPEPFPEPFPESVPAPGGGTDENWHDVRSRLGDDDILLDPSFEFGINENDFERGTYDWDDFAQVQIMEDIIWYHDFESYPFIIGNEDTRISMIFYITGIIPVSLVLVALLISIFKGRRD